MSDATESLIIAAPVPNPKEYTVSAEIWMALKEEINSVAARIDAGEELTPEDVVNVKALRKQVGQYLTTFNKAMRGAQEDYKNLLTKQLADIGYPKIENYILQQREKQTAEQNARIAEKQNQLAEILAAKLAETKILKDTALATELLPAFVHRFPNINSAAKTKEIANWGPYEAVIKTTLNILDVFFGDPIFTGAVLLPVTSATMQQLLTYVREGDVKQLSDMRNVFQRDAEYLKILALKKELRTKADALEKITDIVKQEQSDDQKIIEIARIIRIAETL